MTLQSLSTGATVAWPQVVDLARLVLIFKHSPVCGCSALALEEVRAFATPPGAVPVLFVDVVRQAPLSRRIASELQVGHESPQVILVCSGRVVWTASHFGITRAALEQAMARFATPPVQLEPRFGP